MRKRYDIHLQEQPTEDPYDVSFDRLTVREQGERLAHHHRVVAKKPGALRLTIGTMGYWVYVFVLYVAYLIHDVSILIRDGRIEDPKFVMPWERR